MRIEVPYFSQYDERIPEEWQGRSCGIVSLRMALGAVVPHKELPSPAELIASGVSSGAYVAGIGWRHDGLMRLAELCGARAHRSEFRIRKYAMPHVISSWLNKAFFNYGVALLRSSVQKGTVPIISVTVDGKSDTHLVPIVSWGKREGVLGFYYHEPASQPEDNDALYRFMSIDELGRRWRRLAIFIGSSGREEKIQEQHVTLSATTMRTNPFKVRWLEVAWQV